MLLTSTGLVMITMSLFPVAALDERGREPSRPSPRMRDEGGPGAPDPADTVSAVSNGSPAALPRYEVRLARSVEAEQICGVCAEGFAVSSAGLR